MLSRERTVIAMEKECAYIFVKTLLLTLDQILTTRNLKELEGTFIEILLPKPKPIVCGV